MTHADRQNDRKRRPVTCIAVDDHEAVLAALVEMLASEGISVVAEARTGAEALERLALHRPDLAVVDFNLPDSTGIEVARQGGGISPETGFVLHTALLLSPSMVREALAAGVRGFVPKGSAPQLLLDALATVADGGIQLDGRHDPESLELPRVETADREQGEGRDILQNGDAAYTRCRISQHDRAAMVEG